MSSRSPGRTTDPSADHSRPPRRTRPDAAALLLSRRSLLTGASMAAFAVAGPLGPVTPRQARAQAVPLTTLTEAEGATLAAFGDMLLPGAEAAGITHFIDAQVSRPQPMLTLHYLDWPPPYAAFYQAAAAALDAASQAAYGSGFSGATPEQRNELTIAVATDAVADWQGPPASLVYFVLRADAVDVVYGTVEGFAALNIPYMPHIPPMERW